MFRRALFLSIAAALVSLVTATDVRAWGGFYRGFTVYTPEGFYHHGATAAYGPYGEHTASRSFGYSPYTGAYHAGYGQTAGCGGSSYHYSTGYGGYGGYAGAYRRW